ncbi:winged helix-turn-helix domain-containing protein [Luteimonas sp. RD2P54]|uniref:Winged helix-turn-helix domain-containing protein n=1 Tax=Luteimonas endophytica TaxID=3042023 RepID=A0ABT6JDV8_9GAMM|nr:winged helix-turn-helix domain-containing protein [Luteimonas endophytica]MDH5824750.1 winged helix-turn-helix domain-containing protein [Luteimonas endophytica]
MSEFPDPPEPAPADRARVGEGLVCFSVREITMPGARRPRRVAPKALAVLRVLAEQPGRVVSRAELLDRVWPGTLPTDDVLTQAVTQLRKAFAADAGEAGRSYIETIAKSGYRLVADVEWLRESAPIAAAPPPDPAGDGKTREPMPDTPPLPVVVAAARRRPRVPMAGMFAVIGAALVLILAATLVLLPDGVPAHAAAPFPTVPGTAPDLPYRLITSRPGFELAPTLSPDASMVAYTATRPDRPGTVVLVQTTSSAVPRLLSDPGPDAYDGLPTWSPDGREVAFARTWRDGRCAVLVVAASGSGSPREAARCDGIDLLSFSWTPDGGGLVFGSNGESDAPGIRLLDLASGTWSRLRYPVAPDDFDYAPRYSPDGAWIGFIRNPQLGDLWRVPAAGGQPQRLTSLGAELRGWNWLPDGRAIVFSQRVDSQARLYRLDLDSGAVSDLGLDDAQGPAVAARVPALAFVHRRARFAIHRIDPVALPDGPVFRERLFESSGRDTQPMVSPDGRQLVFTSDRSGRFELWHAELSRPESLRPILGLRPDTRQPAAWSADSTTLLVAGRDRAGAPAIFEVEPATGRAVRLPVPAEHPLQALYVADPAHLLVATEGGSGHTRLVLFDRGTMPWRELQAVEGVSQARFDPARGRVLFSSLAGNGLWEAAPDLAPRSIRQIGAGVPTRARYRTWAVTGDGGIDYLDHTYGCRSRLMRQAGDGSRKASCLDTDRLASTNGFSTDPRTGAVYVSLGVEDGSDIAFMRLQEAPDPILSRFANWLYSLGKSVS